MISDIKLKLNKLLSKNIKKDENNNLFNNAIISLFVEAAAIDGHISENEKEKILFFLTNKFELSISEAELKLQETIQKSKDEIEIWSKTKSIRNDMDYNQRLELIEMLWELVLVDENIDDFEAQLMRRVSGLLFIEDKDSGIAKQRANERLQN